jgi:hypothetical protein
MGVEQNTPSFWLHLILIPTDYTINCSKYLGIINPETKFLGDIFILYLCLPVSIYCYLHGHSVTSKDREATLHVYKIFLDTHVSIFHLKENS